MLVHGRFLSVDTCQHTVDRSLFQYARIKRSPIMSLGASPDHAFKQIYIVQNNDTSLSLIFFVKGPQYRPKSDEEIIESLKSLNRENIEQKDCLWVPAFTVERQVTSVP